MHARSRTPRRLWLIPLLGPPFGFVVFVLLQPLALYGVFLGPIALVLTYVVGFPPALATAAALDIAYRRLGRAAGLLIVPMVAAAASYGWMLCLPILTPGPVALVGTVIGIAAVLLLWPRTLPAA